MLWNLVLGVKAVGKVICTHPRNKFKKTRILGLTFATEADYDKMKKAFYAL
jgi:hypothetical protein